MNTSKIFLSTLIFLSFISFAHSQSYTVRDGWGIVAGGNFSDIVGRNVQVRNEPKFGLRAGFSLESTAMEQFYIRTEFLYSQKGARVSDGNAQPSSILQTYHTIELPVMGCFEFTKGIGIGGGIYGAYLIDTKLESQYVGSSVPFEFQEGDLRKLELGYAVELNFFNPSGVQGGLRYQRSMFTINNSIDRFHQVISAYIGFLFNNGG